MALFDIETHRELFKKLGYDSDTGSALWLRTQLVKTLKAELEQRGWSQKESAEMLGVKPPRISEIYALRIDKFSVELLCKYLDRLGKEITFVIRDKS
ncbi:MAG: helix-turn-helix domain-containing protein [Candidatus Obscuribacterales bacterium]|nr:helix-turn-helix domain-containing protein [Candidatus Obscuribacterales bacterium]